MEQDVIIRAFQEAKRYSERSHCNIRKTGAVLILQNGIRYTATNGMPTDSCKSRGPGYCKRDGSVGGLEYLTCPSFCAEGTAILAAMYDNGEEAVKGSRLVSTDFPCDRCKNIIIDVGISELFFSYYKDGDSRLRDKLFTNQMVDKGVSVNRIIKSTSAEDDKYRIEELKIDPGVERMAMTGIRTPGHYYIAQMLDKEFRRVCLEHAMQLKQLQGQIPPDFEGLVVQPLL